MKRRNRRGNLFTILLGNYIIFTILVITMFVLALWLSFRSADFNSVNLLQVTDYDKELSSGQYEQFPTRRLLGESGFIVVVDSLGQVIYNPNGYSISLTAEEIPYIPDVRSNYSVFTNELGTADRQTHYEITISNSGNQELLVLDENFQIQYSSGKRLNDALTKNQFLLLTDSYFDSYYVRQYPFAAENGEARTLLLFQTSNRASQGPQDFVDTLFGGFGIFLLLYILLIFLLILWLRRKISTPLRLLCDALQNYKIGSRMGQNYQGPREFAEIFDSFSDMAHRLEDSEQRRKALEENRRKMLTDITHDLKTPVAVIQGYARALNDGVIPPAEQSSYLLILEQKSSELNELVNTFYEYNRLEHPNFSLNLQQGDICNYFRDFVAEQYTTLEMAGFSLEVDIPGTHIPCMIDKGQLKRAFSNIVGNATKHTPKGTTLYFELSAESGTVTLTLADNGPGIPCEIARDIFTPFVMGDASRGGGGSGLGLSIAKRIVEAHGGTIQLAELPEWATAFEVTLPILQT